jgi:hypothetical protein
VQLAAELDLPRYVETNAGWCVSEEAAVQRLSALQEAGMQALIISCDPFHAETVPPARTRLAWEKALEILGPERAFLRWEECLEWLEQFHTDKPTPLEQYVEKLGPERAGRLFWHEYGLHPAARCGYRLGHLTDQHPVSAFRGQNCRRDLLLTHHSHLDPYGNYITGFCAGLTLGDWQDMPRLWAEALADRFPPLIGILVHSGPYGLAEMAARDYEYQPLPDGYVGKCHLCVDVRRALVPCDEFRELQPLEFYTAF